MADRDTSPRPGDPAPASRLSPAYAGREFDSPLRLFLALLLNVPTVLKIGFHEPLVPEFVLHGSQLALLGLYLLSIVVSARLFGPATERRTDFLAVTRPEQVAAVLGLLTFFWTPGAKIAAAFLLLFALTRLYLRLVRTRIPTGLVFLGSFVALTVAGSLALLLPAATPPDRPITFVDALFTITSAISQTGLVVRPTGEAFTRFGQIIILAWIQVGALGVIVFGAVLVNVIGSSLSLRATQTIAEGTEQGWSGQLGMQKLVTFIIVFTHAVELIGAVLLYLFWPVSWMGDPADFATEADRVYHAVFFAVSAFCNAGFVTTEASMYGLRAHWTTHFVVGGLIMLGSIGFPALDNMRRVLWARIRGIRMRDGALVRLNLNTKLILVATLIVYVIGAALVFPTVALYTDEPLIIALADAHFMTVNRTAGFSTIQPADGPILVQLGYIALMAVGGSPGSVAGGIKVIAVAVLALSVWATIRGRDATVAFGRTIPEPLVRKCAALAILWVGSLLAFTSIVTVSEQDRGYTLEQIMFEVTSALATCGLSSGVSDDISTTGKLALTAAMFIGRVGPFAVLAALLSTGSARRSRYAYPHEDVTIY